MDKSLLLLLLLVFTVYTLRKDDLFIIHDQSQDQQQIFRFFYDLNDGYYVDIGAYDPILISNTLNLYARGWSGLNVEAHPQRFASFPSVKYQDVSLNIAISQKSQIVNFYEFKSDVSQSTVNQDVYKSLNKLDPNFTKLQIPALSVKQVCQRYFKKKPNYLNLDIQGLSSVFIKTNDWTNQKCRPEIIFVEMDDVPGYSFNWTVSHKQQMKKVGYTLVSAYIFNQIYIDDKVYEYYMKKQKIGLQIQSKKNHVSSQDQLTNFYKQLKLDVSDMFQKWKNNYESQVYYFYPKEGSTFCLEDINRRSNTLSLKKNRPILIQMFNPNNTSFFIKSNSYKIQYLNVKQYTYQKITVTKANGQSFVTYIFNMDELVQKTYILNTTMQQIQTYKLSGAIIISTVLTACLSCLFFNRKWKKFNQMQTNKGKIQTSDDISVAQ